MNNSKYRILIFLVVFLLLTNIGLLLYFTAFNKAAPKTNRPEKRGPGITAFLQNDLGVAVKMSDAFAIKSGFQIRRNSDVGPGVRKTDRLFTTNLVYSF